MLQSDLKINTLSIFGTFSSMRSEVVSMQQLLVSFFSASDNTANSNTLLITKLYY